MGPRCGAYNEAGNHLKISFSAFVSSRQIVHTRFPKRGGMGTRGIDVSAKNLHQGFTHVFVSTFESTEGIAEYVSHPAHVEFANKYLQQLDKILAIDYKPTTVKLS
ncbi:hypothetical protein IEQ34_012131 [Dendrobium chrysotoxum]|uniref:Stress-response A/B barrel domain-containing protein n=1 Tax=Dendrobium chrysotoxum TaxID=161865 RepID=A0AAV7GUT0_DENCH|nr:hypothetical protein IEQ34_012131 [Dendrobium chrysotoxum]